MWARSRVVQPKQGAVARVEEVSGRLPFLHRRESGRDGMLLVRSQCVGKGDELHVRVALRALVQNSAVRGSIPAEIGVQRIPSCSRCAG